VQINSVRKLNLGCGTTYRKDWINIDIAPISAEVLPFNLKEGIPFPNNSFDAVYHSHVLEHFSRQQGETLIKECTRVLKPKGILRVAIPDLEKIVREYLKKLEEALEDRPNSNTEYDWIMVELFDQMVRDHSGGQMGEMLAKNPLPNLPYIVERIGSEGLDLREKLLNSGEIKKRSIFERVKFALISGSFVKRIHRTVLIFITRIVGGTRAVEALERGLFQLSGEHHLWMYDRFSLTRLLEANGYSEIKICAAEESNIPEFTGSGLEKKNGKIRKPDSLFIEGVLNP
jgi:predicted SAM-dependent methyltransferase